jgi:MFS family permease
MSSATPPAGATLPGEEPTHIRHVVVGVATLMSFLLYLDRFCPGFVQGRIMDELHLSGDDTAWLLGVFYLSYALGQVPSGWLSDRFGARRTLALYILLWSLFTALMGVVYAFPLLLLLRLGCGLGQAGAYPTSGNLLSKWVPFRERATASSLVTVGGRFGGVAAPILTAYLLAVCGWQSVFLVYGLAGLPVAAVYWLYFRDRPREHAGCNAAEISLIESGRPASATSPHGPVGALPWRGLLRSRSLWLSSVSQFGTNFGWIFLTNSLPPYLDKVHHVPEIVRGWLSGLPYAVGMVGMFAGGWLTDRLTRVLGLRRGRMLPMALTRFTAAAAFLACPWLGDPWLVTAAMAVVALSTDLGTPATWAFMQDVGGRNVGSVLGWGNMWGNLGAFLSPIVLQRLRAGQTQGDWNVTFLACAVAFLVAGVAALGIDATVPVAEDKS